MFAHLGRGLVGAGRSIGRGVRGLLAPSGSPPNLVGPSDISASFLLGHGVGILIAVALGVLKLLIGGAHLIPNPILSGGIALVLTLAYDLFRRLGHWQGEVPGMQFFTVASPAGPTPVASPAVASPPIADAIPPRPVASPAVAPRMDLPMAEVERRPA